MWVKEVYIIHSSTIDIPQKPRALTFYPKDIAPNSDQVVTKVMVPASVRMLCVTIGYLRSAKTNTQSFQLASVSLKHPPNLAVLNNEKLVGTPLRWVGPHFTFVDVIIEDESH